MMTPAEMAERLARIALRLPAGTTQSLLDSSELSEIIAYLRQQPTDAQKIEALALVGEVGVTAGLYQDAWGDNELPPPIVATRMAHDARAALRLLGLPTE